MLSIKERFIDNLKDIVAPEGFKWELINRKHSSFIVDWRNDASNLALFYNQENIDLETQNKFIEKYNTLDRVDLILSSERKNNPVAVFSIKNLSTRPELGKLIGDQRYRGVGLGSKATRSFLDYLFNTVKCPSLFAETRTTNTINIAINEKLGFKIIDSKKVDNKDFYIMRLDISNYE